MANKYPYVASPGPLLRTIEHLRRSFPKEVTADTLRKLGVAPKNESYVINVLKFLGVIDSEGKKNDAKSNAFVQHKEEAFTSEFEKLVRDAYQEIFDLHGDQAWTLDRGGLTQFFRSSDHTSNVVGTRQAGTFAALAALSGHAELPSLKESTPAARKSTPKKKKETKTEAVPDHGGRTSDQDDKQQIGLTVRIEVNLPADGNQETYDRIFRSIRKNLIDGE